jgi:hypothetical protein
MRSSFIVVASIFMLGLVFSHRSNAQTVPTNYVLQWSDNFTGGVLDATKWNYRTDVKSYSAQLPANISVDSSDHMNISLQQQIFAGKSFTGGGIVSKASFRYGLYVVQAMTTANPGWHTSFWLYAGNGATTYVPTSFTEIDDFEINSDTPTSISMGVIEWANGSPTSGGPGRCNAAYKPGFSTAAGFHTYGVEWTEQQVNYYLDDFTTPICSQAYPATGYTHDLLNIWLTSIGYTSDISVINNPSPASFTNVAYYVRDYYIGNSEPGYAEYGSGWNASSLSGFSNLPSRYSCDAGASATWTPTILAAGNYDVWVYRISNSGSDPNAQLTIVYNGGQATQSVNFTSGTSGWVELGTYPFAAGSQGFLKNANSGSGCTRASMVKFVRQ